MLLIGQYDSPFVRRVAVTLWTLYDSVTLIASMVAVSSAVVCQ